MAPSLLRANSVASMSEKEIGASCAEPAVVRLRTARRKPRNRTDPREFNRSHQCALIVPRRLLI